MSRLRIFVGGVHGVGKSVICEELVDLLQGEYIVASRLLKWKLKSKQVQNVLQNQEILVDLFKKKIKNDSTYIIDGHFALWNENHKCEKVPVETFSAFKLNAIILITCSVEVILERLINRDGLYYKKEDIKQLQSTEIEQARIIAKRLSIPIFIVDSTKLPNIKKIMKQIEMIKPYTRDNILSNMLKTVIIRADFQGLTDLPSFISKIKSKEKMMDTFERMIMLPKQNMRVSFRPKDIEDGLLPLTENQKSIIYRFFECKIGDKSKVTLDIEPDAITLAVNCQENYQGSKDYTYFIGWIIDELRSFDPYVIIKRLGVRKIDVQVLSEGENIDSYFNEKYVVAQSWKNHPFKTASILTELFQKDKVFYNVVQRIDCTNDKRERLIFDVDAYLTEENLGEVLNSGNVADLLYHDIQDYMFDLFVNVASVQYLDSCKK